MPLNAKGKKILSSMQDQYGDKKGKSVFYAMENSGKLKNVTAANKGLGVSFGPPPKRGPNPQVPPVKMNTGGDACCSECVDTRGTKSIQVKGFNFRGVR